MAAGGGDHEDMKKIATYEKMGKNHETVKKIVKKTRKKLWKTDSGNVLLTIGFWEMSFELCPFQ